MAADLTYLQTAKAYAKEIGNSRQKFEEFYQKILNDTINYNEENVPPYELPPLLKMENGCRVETAQQWLCQRRPEILEMLKRELYGKVIPRPDQLEFELLTEKKDAFNGLAIRREVRIHAGMQNGKKFSFDLLLYIPKNAPRPVPAFLGLNFKGNHACTVEKDVMMTPARFVSHEFQDAAAAGKHYGNAFLPVHDPELYTEDKRGYLQERYSFEEVLKRGYASGTICYHDLFPDSIKGWGESCLTLFGDFKNYVGGHDEYTSIGAWAWGLSRALDYLETCPEIDSERVAVHGHSRLGKTALWTGAIDPRFYMTISNDSGCGGAALSRRCFGETFLYIVSNMSHWFLNNMRNYIAREEEMPFDQHFLAAMTAPRPLAVASATLDQWADPKGEFLCAKAVNEVYALFGSKGLEAETMPPPDTPVTGDVSYHIRTGKHAQALQDWNHYLDIADRYLKRK